MLIIFILAFQKDEKSIFPLYYCILCFPFQKDESVIKMFRAAKRFRKRLTLTRHKSRHNAILAFTFYTSMNHYCDELIILGWWTLNIAEKLSQRCEALLLDSGHCSFASCPWSASKILCKCLEMYFIKLLSQPLRPM